MNLVRTLEKLSNRDRQRNYKADVPFVHVPRELLAQWQEYTSLLKERRDWFIKSLSESELAAMMAFDEEVGSFNWEGRLPDVPAVFDMPQWVGLMHGANQLLVVLNSNRTECEQDGAANGSQPFGSG